MNPPWTLTSSVTVLGQSWLDHHRPPTPWTCFPQYCPNPGSLGCLQSSVPTVEVVEMHLNSVFKNGIFPLFDYRTDDQGGVIS